MLDRLAAVGIASLRFEKRGVGSNRGKDDLGEASFDALIDDAEAALDAMAGRPEISRLPLILIGHSEGGLVALDIAARRTEVAGLALLAVAGRPLDKVLAQQVQAQARDIGLSAKTQAYLMRKNAEFFIAVRAVPEWSKSSVSAPILAQKHLRRFLAEQFARDPVALAERQRVPLLILQGDRDEQISLEDAELLSAAATRGGTTVTVSVMRGLDHLFKRPKNSGQFDAYFDRRRRPARKVVNAIKAWVKHTVLRP